MSDRADDLPALAIRRPWLVIVVNLLIIIAGAGAWLGVEVRELPNIDRPIVAVRANYPGAAPETLDAEVTRVIEGAAARVPGVHLVRSASEEGNLRVIIEFNPGVDLVVAANDVRDAVARIESELPDGVEDLTIVKADADAEPILQLAVSSNRLAIDELSRIVEDRIEPELISVPGVADITLFGERQRVMRVRIDASQLAARGLAIRRRRHIAALCACRRARRQPRNRAAGGAGAGQRFGRHARTGARATPASRPGAGRRSPTCSMRRPTPPRTCV